MLERMKYVNNRGDIIEFGKNGFYANENDLRNYSWAYDTDRNNVENFRRSVTKKRIPIVIRADTEEEGTKHKNRIFDVFEYDVILGMPGKLWIGDYFMECYLVENSKSNYLCDKKIMNISINIVSDKGNWIKKTKYDFIHKDLPDTSGRGYPYGYPYDYSMGAGYMDSLNNDHFAPCDFILKISGYVQRPSITIGGHIYRVNETVQSNEILTIDSMKKTIILTKNNGVEVNDFAKRDRESYTFEKIPSGENLVYWNAGFDWELTLIEERSEPKWI